MTAQPVKASKGFGAGSFVGINNVINPTPTTFDSLQDWEVQWKRDAKSMFGRGQFAEDVCAGAATVTGKLTGGSFTGRAFGDLIIGAGTQAQMYNWAKFERQTVDNSHQIRARNHGAAKFIRDCGVRDPATNIPLLRVKNITKKNHYTVDAGGTYAFDPHRDGDDLDISYMWNGNTTGLGSILLITNQPQGKTGAFTSVASADWNGEENVVTLYSCMATDASLGTKQGDYYKPPFSFMAQCDNYGNLGSMSFAQNR
jgi:hypothetical protein